MTGFLASAVKDKRFGTKSQNIKSTKLILQMRVRWKLH